MFNCNYWSANPYIVFFVQCRTKGTSFNIGYLTNRLNIPTLWDNANFSLLESLSHFHENPIFSRCWFTLDSNSSTCAVSCGMGVS